MGTELGCHAARGFGIGIDDANEFAIVDRSVLLGMEAPEIPDANDGRSDFIHAAGYYACVIDLGAQWRSLTQHYSAARGLWRELLAVLICLALGVLLMPSLIFLAGRLALGPYARGNLFALWRDFLQALAGGSRAAWFVLLGPYLLFWLLRGGRRLLHNQP
jgi:hypothetical protein